MLTSDYLLATTIEAFDTWRAGKSHPSSPTPQPLHQQALALIEHFSMTRIVQALNLSKAMLQDWLHKQQSEHAEHKPNTFITLPVEHHLRHQKHLS